MNFLVLKNNKIYYYIQNINSDNLGFYFSFFLHLVILLFAIGIPNFFKPKLINVPTIIPIEIINISNITSIPKEIKETNKTEVKKIKIKENKFNSSDNTEIKKIDIKEKPKIDKKENEKIASIKDDVLVVEKKKKKIKIQKKELKIVKTKQESLPTKKIKPKLKLKPKPKQVTEDQITKSDVVIKEKPIIKSNPDFNIASMLKDLRNEKSNLQTEVPEELEEKQIIEQKTDSLSDENARLSISEIDLLRQQLSLCWNAPSGAVIEKGMLVKISAKLKKNRRIFDNSVRIVDTNISKSNAFYGPITESAMRTLLNPECIPLKLPEEKYELWKNLSITFDYSIMKED